ncbi:glycosyltransferase family 4 protein [Geobacter pelophilus]|uniref:Glycosyltransferase family 4 protein n=1 Tax=Geoanaerobacter pelophilus TaxID=60036 RepID=A0AAW4KWQ2_9BACT|nr:glycosyltransferase family 4 protein [Geoanaerobacter pelophilus]MBT0663016.1 glycosyltransferase family 4 protein [Geoanaerobacter pelophilus]
MKSQLNIILAPHATFERWQQVGLFDRQKKYFKKMASEFDVSIYSADTDDYSEKLGILHHFPKKLINRYGIRHIQFYQFILKQAPAMKGIIRVYGTSVPFLQTVKRKSNAKLVVSFHNDWGAGVKKDHPWTVAAVIGNRIQRSALCAADLVLATHEWLAIRAGEITPAPIAINPNFVDDSVFCYSNCKEPLIVFAGRIHWSKGIKYLIDAFAKIKVEFPSYRLIFAGEGEERPNFEAYIKSQQIKDVVFLGAVENNKLADLMRRAAIYVLPSVNMEGHPKALIEAMACGATPIVTDVPGNRDLVSDGKNGLLVKSKDTDSLYKALKQLCENVSFRQMLGQEAYNSTKKYDFNRVVNNEIQVIRNKC